MRDQQLQSAKQVLRSFLASQSVEYLTRVADACRSGRFHYRDPCCCVMGLTEAGWRTANQGASLVELAAEHALLLLSEYKRAKDVPIFNSKQQLDRYYCRHDRLGRVRTLPLVLSEIKKRHRVPTAPPVEVACEPGVAI